MESWPLVTWLLLVTRLPLSEAITQYHTRSASSFSGTEEREEHPKGHAAQLTEQEACVASTSFWKEL